jgi:hypothetical protein
MYINISQIDLHERQTLILERIDGLPIGVLGLVSDVSAELNYNEISSLNFKCYSTINNIDVPYYSELTTLKYILWKDVGRFVITEVNEVNDGVLYKTVKCQSLEIELTYKKIFIESQTINFYDAVSINNSVIGRIMEKLPDWTLQEISSSLIGKYRNIESNNDNVYDFIKSVCQPVFGIIVDFDTINKKIYIKDINDTTAINPVYLSSENLVKKLDIKQDYSQIFTAVTVTGAEGIDISSVNPMGNNTLINLSAYMNTSFVSQTICDKYALWASTFEGYRGMFYNLTIQQALLTQQKVSAEAELKDMNGVLGSYYALQSTFISAIASGDASKQSDLNIINASIDSQNNVIAYQKQLISVIEYNLTSVLNTMSDINDATNIESFFTEAEWKVVNRLIKEDAIQESSFYANTVSNYDYTAMTDTLSSVTFSITNSVVTELEVSPYPRLRTIGELDSLTLGELDSWTLGEMDVDTTGESNLLYTAKGGSIISSGGGINLSSNIIRLTLLKNSLNNSILLTVFLANGVILENEFISGCMSASGTCGAITFNEDSLSFTVSTGNLYFTEDNTNNFQKFSVELDLLDYGLACLEKLSQPSFQFSIDSSNFLMLSEFIAFKNALTTLGNKLYINVNGTVLTPYFLSLKLHFEKPDDFQLGFSDTYTKRGIYDLESLLSPAVSAGASLNYSKNSFSAFKNSGAATALSKIKNDSLDYSKNQILSASGEGIIINDSGISGVKWKDGSHTEYEAEQWRGIHNQICFTSSSWNDVSLALGKIKWGDGYLYGLNAQVVYGDLIAGQNLYISSSKQYGGEAVFKVDADGVKLINSVFDSYAGNSQISINPYRGIVAGLANLYSDSNYTLDMNKVKFWMDIDTGDVNIAGDANIAGSIYAKNLYLGNGTINVLNALNKIKGTSLDLTSVSVVNAISGFNSLSVEEDGDILLGHGINSISIVNGVVSFGSGVTLNWNNISGAPSFATQSTINSIINGTYTGGTFISGTTIYSPVLYGNSIIVKSNALDDTSSGFYIQDKTDSSNIFFIRHITSGGNKQSFIRGVTNTSMVFGDFKIGSTDYDGLGTKSQTTMRGIWKLDSDICGSTVPEHDDTKPYRVFFKIPA